MGEREDNGREKRKGWRRNRDGEREREEADWEVKIKGYEAAARPKSRNRKRYSPPSTSRSTVREGEKEDQASCVEKQKKERNYKEEGNIYSEEETRLWRTLLEEREKEKDWRRR